MSVSGDISLNAPTSAHQVWVERRAGGRTAVVFWSSPAAMPAGFAGWNVRWSPEPCSDLTSASLTLLTEDPLGVPFLIVDDADPTGRPSYLVSIVDGTGEHVIGRPTQVHDTSDPARQGRRFFYGGPSMPKVFAEFRRRRELLLGPKVGPPGVGTAEDVIVLVRRHAGTRCPRCFSGTRENSTRADCAICWGTAWARGYERVDGARIRVGRITDILRIQTSGTEIGSNPRAWHAGFPLLRPGDVIVRPKDGVRYSAGKIELTEHQGILTGQDYDLIAFDPRHPIYSYPI